MMNIWDLVESQKLASDHLDIKQEYLIEGFLPKRMISVWYADGGTGKSYLAYGFVKVALEKEMRVVFIDPDNSLSVVKERNIHGLLIEPYSGLYYLHRSSMDIEPLDLLEHFNRGAVGKAYENTLFVVDSLKDVVWDMGNDLKVSKAMHILINIREAGGTVLVLHHTNKDGKNYQGSNQIRNSADVMYRLHQKPSSEGNINYYMEVQKERAGVINKGWSLDIASLNLTELDESIAKMSQSEIKFTQAVTEALKGGDMRQTELLNAIGSHTGDKTTRAMLDKFDGKIYKSEYRTHNKARAKIYFLKDTEATKTTETPKNRTLVAVNDEIAI